jgi:phosphomannomutase
VSASGSLTRRATLPPMTQAPLMVGVSGLRGITGKSLTPEVAARYAGAFGSWLRERRGPATKRQRNVQVDVAIGCDGRAGAEATIAAATSGLLASGCSVIKLDVAMTPTVATVVDALGLAGGMQVTASHNPQEWNGLKLFVRDPGLRRGAPSACAPTNAIASEIIERFRTNRIEYAAWEGVGTARFLDHAEAHTSAVEEAIGQLGVVPRIKRKKFEVALDSVGGAGGLWSRMVLDWGLGCKVHAIGQYETGLFTHTPEPLRENLTGLCRAVRRSKAQVGFAQDPDADRLAIVDERGKYIGEEYTLVLAAEALLGAAPPTRKRGRDRLLVTNLSTSRMLDDIAAKYNASVIRTPVGEANVVEAMKREKAAGRDVVLGGEGNGGVIWPKVTYVRDSLSSMALVLALMARTGKTVSQLVSEIPAYAIEKRKVDLSKKEDAAPAVAKLAAAYEQHTIDLQDGIRIDFTHGPLAGRAWLHVRASNTEPIMRLIAEAPDPATAKEILDDAARAIGA